MTKRNSLLAALAVALAVYAGVLTYFYSIQDAMIFPQTVKPVPVATLETNPNMEVIGIGVEGAMLSGLLLPPLEKHAEAPTLVLAFGGNAHDVTGFVTFLKNEIYPHANVAVAGFSYRGYPNALEKPSTGTPTEKNLEADALQVYDLMSFKLNPARVVVIGYSLGTAVATHVAQQRPVAALALVAPFSSMADLVKHKYAFLPVDALLKYPFDTEGRLKEMATRPNRPPLTIMYSPTDGLIPPDEPQKLAAAYPGARLVNLAGATHGSILHHADFPAEVKKAFK
ncbi:MAG TPA: hypothetical protein VHP58_06825 [Alphaproteobacteria bacterium]|nr:hypothetical protein [Alphaproteobacteria bacterium]